MLFGMCNASATFQRVIAGAVRENFNRERSMVMAYIDDIVIATETDEDHMSANARLRDQVRVQEVGDHELGILGRIVSAEGVKLDPKAKEKLRDWEIPRNWTEMQSVLCFAN